MGARSRGAQSEPDSRSQPAANRIVVGHERLRGLPHDAMQAPAFAPDVAVEILSPDDDLRDVAAKVDVYLRAGTALVFVVDPPSRIIRVHDASGETVLTVADTLRHAALREFALPLGPLFSRALDLPR